MVAYINSNSTALTTQRSLSTAQNALATSIQRLSSGLRINSAKDDAAGMAIADGMTTLIRGQTVAMRNANDAISLSQTTEGALGKRGDLLQRMRELAVQSANATNSDTDRVALNTEFMQMQDELVRIRKGTTFNGNKVFSNIEVDITSANQLNDVWLYHVMPQPVGAPVDDAHLILNSWNAYKSTTATPTVQAWFDATNCSALNKTFQIGAGTGGATNQIKTDVAFAPTTVGQLYGEVFSNEAFGSEYYESLGAFKVLTRYDGTDYFYTATDGSQIASADSAYIVSHLNDPGDILTAGGATDIMKQIDSALKQVNTEMVEQGALQNRMTSVIANLQTSNENLMQARSRIMDTDYAAETASLARSQILQQVGMAMLAQANQSPKDVLALLR